MFANIIFTLSLAVSRPTTIYPIDGALRFFYGTTLGRPDIAEQIPLAPHGRIMLPAVLARDEVVRFLRQYPISRCEQPSSRSTPADCASPRPSHLTARDIDSARMVIHVRQGKGRKDRYVMLSEQLLGILRDYWQRARPPHWLFPGPKPSRRSRRAHCSVPVGERPKRPGSTNRSPSTRLRHSFATHLLEQGVDIRVIQDLLGHRHIKSTTGYARVAINMIRQIQSPLELLNMASDPAGLMRRQCPSQSWRWRMFSAATEPLGVLPTRPI